MSITVTVRTVSVRTGSTRGVGGAGVEEARIAVCPNLHAGASKPRSGLARVEVGTASRPSDQRR
eukprot:3934353-Rhodomonas_salina.2